MTPKGRRRACSRPEAGNRLRHAEAYFVTAELVASEPESEVAAHDYNHVAAGVAVLAAIAASDAICCQLLGERARGQDHRDAIALLGEVRFGAGSPQVQRERATALGRALATALDIKDQSHYGTQMVARHQVTRVMRAAEDLLIAARSIVRHQPAYPSP